MVAALGEPLLDCWVDPLFYLRRLDLIFLQNVCKVIKKINAETLLMYQLMYIFKEKQILEY